MAAPQIVIDTNVLVSAFRSQRGASHKLISQVDAGRFEINLSVPLVLEYEDALSRPGIGFSSVAVGNVIDYLCAVANRREVFYLWRPWLVDPKDDMVLELAVTAGCDHILTFNKRDFAGIERFGLSAISPSEFLLELGDDP